MKRSWTLLKANFLLIAIVALAVFLRFDNFSNRITMYPDSVRDAIVSLEGAKAWQFPLVGPFISISPVTTGPWYWNQLVLARIILPTDLAPWILVGLYSVGMVVAMYFVGYVLDGKRLGLITALITCLADNQIRVASELTNPSVIGFYCSVVLLLFVVLVKRGPNKFLGLIMGLVLGLAINTHFQTAGMLSLVLTLLVFGKKYLKTLVETFKGLAFTFLPLLYFELLNHWFNTRNMLSYLLVGQYKIYVPMSWKIYVTDYWPQFVSYVLTGTGKWFGASVIAGLIVVLGLKFLRKDWPRIYWLIALSFLAQVVVIRYYRGEKFFGYLQFFHPFLFLFIALAIDYLFKQKRLGIVIGSGVLILLLAFMIPPAKADLANTAFTVQTRQMTANLYRTFGPGPYKIYRCDRTFKWEINALVLQLEMDKRYSSSGTPLIYRWGCTFPLYKDGTKVPNEDNLAVKFYPRSGALYDVTNASPSSVLVSGWNETSPKLMYQSAARWWFDEQP